MPLTVSLRYKAGDFTLDIDLRSQARRIGILGPSGAGKSMTLKLIAGILTPDDGEVRVDGRVLYDKKTRIHLKPQKRRVGYLFQNYALFPSMTVAGNIGIGIRGPAGERERVVGEMIRRFHLGGLENHYPRQLSGGQQQRVALARILAGRPEVILLDEPFSALDVWLRDQMNRELSDVLDAFPGVVMMVSHSRDEIYRFSEDVVIMDQGRIMDQGEKKAVFARPSTLKSAALTGCENFSRARRIDDHTVEALSWQARIHTARAVPERLSVIGCRAHAFEPVWGERRENCIPFAPERQDELPDRRSYAICFPGRDTDPYGTVVWTAGRDMWEVLERKGLPDYLRVKEEEMLFF